MTAYFETPVEFLKGVGPQRASLLKKELSIFTYGDLIQHYPFRYEDRTRFYDIKEINDEMPYVQLKGHIVRKEVVGAGRKKRLIVHLRDNTGEIELIWFQGITWIIDKLKTGIEYIVFGKPTRYGSKFNIAHPEIEVSAERKDNSNTFHPVYPLTEKLRSRHIESKTISKLIQQLLELSADKIRETLPEYLLREKS